MHDGVRVVIADGDSVSRKQVKEALGKEGYLVIAETIDARNTLKIVFQTEPDLVIIDSSIPGYQELEIARIIKEHRVAPIILIGDFYELGVYEEEKASWVMAYLLKPVSESSLLPTIEIALANFKELVRLEEENKNLRKALESRKLVEKAKGLLMEKRGLTEQEAYKYLQKNSMNRCVPIARIAKEVIKGV